MKSWRHGFFRNWIRASAVDISTAATVAGAAMLSVSGATRVLVATSTVDLRGSLNRLYGLVVGLRPH
jgi:hypothetical protein